jgi:phosphatidylethanolamine-binding protein (PEBP) family uncharacterized protein
MQKSQSRREPDLSKEYIIRDFGLATVLAVGGLIISGAAEALTLPSPDLESNGRFADEQVFNGWRCAGKNLSPALNWAGAPQGTKSFAVSMFDPEAPTGSGFWHWWVANIPEKVDSLTKGAGDVNGSGLPREATQVRNDFSVIGYSGPCPIRARPTTIL